MSIALSDGVSESHGCKAGHRNGLLTPFHSWRLSIIKEVGMKLGEEGLNKQCVVSSSDSFAPSTVSGTALLVFAFHVVEVLKNTGHRATLGNLQRPVKAQRKMLARCLGTVRHDPSYPSP